MISNLNSAWRNTSNYVLYLDSFSFPIAGISITKKKKNQTLIIEFRVVFTYAVKILNNLNENWSSY